jgi:hypothetical protein
MENRRGGHHPPVDKIFSAWEMKIVTNLVISFFGNLLVIFFGFEIKKGLRFRVNP